MQSGVSPRGYIAMIEGLSPASRPNRHQDEGHRHRRPRQFPSAIPTTTATDEIDGDLTIRGLRYIWRANHHNSGPPLVDPADPA